ncbi:MAG: hypothetical protein ACOYN0_13985 [Phycisphaerales bacterium]
MTMLVHLIDERQSSSVRRSGLKGVPREVSTNGTRISLDAAVYAMPVLPSFFASHQWLRELKRRGMRTISAAYFRMRADARVWVGKYNGDHRCVPLGHAAGLIMHETDPRGWEIVIPNSVPAKAIQSIRAVPQVVGWRFFPESHKDGPWKCVCAFCLESNKGEIKAKKFVRRLIERHGANESPEDEDFARVVKWVKRK